MLPKKEMRCNLVTIILIVLINLMVACLALNRDLLAGRIVNGITTDIRFRPYQVSLQKMAPNSHFCGGSIIAEDIVVTAAHCVVSANALDLRVRLGSTYSNRSGELVTVRSLKYHEEYNNTHRKYDVAVLKLDTPVRESATVRYIKLAKSLPKTGTPAIVSGWGTMCFMFCPASEVLREVEVSFLQRDVCASEDYKYGDNITDTMICAYTETKDSCQGDSGGPLVADGKLIGIVSWGQGCAFTGYPGVYADVTDLREWILKTASEL